MSKGGQVASFTKAWSPLAPLQLSNQSALLRWVGDLEFFDCFGDGGLKVHDEITNVSELLFTDRLSELEQPSVPPACVGEEVFVAF
jgi:hypothetical protein